MTTNQTIDGVQREQMACMPVERCYDVRAKMIIAFNETKKAGGDLDDALDAAYKSALRYSPNPTNAEHPAPVAVVMPEQLNPAELDELEVIEVLLSGQGLSNLAGTMAAARQFIDELKRLNPSL
ncbi:hypothetical protein FX985_03322 [Pseudomonas extremaustralis]|uniref:Uncharacterized protein n=1 Tax=Pseudomonas extremaustralis TaxID=359110 RepID=A0A5M9J2F3_9PSED|nr:hypothetical protein [Pseudomonas extremaustralis]KAA8563254.1 hypothetical protein FX985_03322 [Pseudomonas extremaustralis]